MRAWRAAHPRALRYAHFGFNHITFTPWTTLDDLAANAAGLRRTRLDRRRGGLLRSRARLYPDTALYHLARRDGLLVPGSEDAQNRHGYLPPAAWRFRQPEVAHFALLASALCDRTQGRDELVLFEALLDAFARAPAWRGIAAEAVYEDWERRRSAGGLLPLSAPQRARVAALLAPLPLDGAFAGGWRFEALRTAPGLVQLALAKAGEAPLVVEIARPLDAASLLRTRHYEVRAPQEPPPAAREALAAVCAALARNDA
jgi:hypothetical protein